MNSRDWTRVLTLENSSRSWRALGAYASEFMRPTIRIGVTGLARSGKTIFITSLIHNLINHGRLPFFAAAAQGRIRRAYLEPQPDDDVPRFAYEQHLEALTGEEPYWPESTSRVSQVRLTVEFASNEFFKRSFGQNTLSIDIVDYPGEWILDLPLLSLSYDEWSEQSVKLAQMPERVDHAARWLSYLNGLVNNSDERDAKARDAALLFTAYLKRCREDDLSFSTVPPGRFLMPGDMAGSPALTFSPMLADGDGTGDALREEMARRFEAYKTHVIKPFFTKHFSQLDRQIILVDVLQALNGGPPAMRDLERALSDVLRCFRPGRNSWLASILGKRIDRLVFAATKADHVHHESHNRLEAVLEALTSKAIERARFSGAEVKVLAMAALRATREAEVTRDGVRLPCILGYPLKGEKLGPQSFDGHQEVAIFPGDLPEDALVALAEGRAKAAPDEEEMRFIRFRPPLADEMRASAETRAGMSQERQSTALPHIRLDRAIEFLIGDKLS